MRLLETGAGRTAITMLASARVWPTGCGGRTLQDVRDNHAALLEDMQHWKRRGAAVLLGGNLNARIGRGVDDTVLNRVLHFGKEKQRSRHRGLKLSHTD